MPAIARIAGLVYDERMKDHYAIDDPEHPEQPARIDAIVDELTRQGLAAQCVRIPVREASKVRRPFPVD